MIISDNNHVANHVALQQKRSHAVQNTKYTIILGNSVSGQVFPIFRFGQGFSICCIPTMLCKKNHVLNI